MSLSTIRTQIQTEIGGRTDVNTIIDDHINFAYLELATTLKDFVLEKTAYTTTAASQYKYDLPSDCFALLVVKNETNNQLLEEADIQQFDQRDETSTGTPTHWTRFNNALYLFDPVPDNNASSNYTIKIRYWVRPTLLSADGDDILFKDELERGVRLLASSGVHFTLNNLERAKIRTQEYNRWLGRYTQPQAAEDEHANVSRFNFGSR